MFSSLTPELLTQLSSQNITFNSHHWGVATETFQSSDYLRPFFNILSTNKDRNGIDFVSSMECECVCVWAVSSIECECVCVWAVSRVCVCVCVCVGGLFHRVSVCVGGLLHRV